MTEAQANCPYCGEEITLLVDCSVEEQVYTEDCSVCCKPMLVHVEAVEGELTVLELGREDGA